MSTPGLALPHLSPSQSGKSTSVNTIADGLDTALTQQATINMAGGVDVTPSASAVKPYMILKLTGAITANIKLILPNSGHVWIVNNQCTGAFTITLKAGTGTATFVMNAADVKLVYCDGNNSIIHPT